MDDSRRHDKPLNDALDIILDQVKTVTETEIRPLEKCLGRILREDVIAPINVPQQDTAAVDGYAFYADDIADKNLPLPVLGSIKAGHPYQGTAHRGSAYRIFTGAPMPAGPDTVAMEEYCTTEEDGRITLPHGIRKGANFRPMGENVRAGDTVLRAGSRLGPSEIGLAAAVGVDRLEVSSPLKIAVLSMGDEVQETGSKQGFEKGMIHDSNRPMLKALMTTDQFSVLDGGIIPDDRTILTRAFADLLANADVLVTSGGSSAGEEDHARQAIIDNGGLIDFWRLAMKPGRPMAVGRIGNKLVFCLPGNPVAAFVCYRLLVAPVLTRLEGGTIKPVMKITVPAAFSHKHKPGRAEYLRARLAPREDGILAVTLHGRAGAGVLSSLTGADGLVEIPADIGDVKEGDPLPFIPLREPAL
ncbi:gephyrin-like molybdotransferase Glp [Alphaproteobacteria bacterium LSUCC0684]